MPTYSSPILSIRNELRDVVGENLAAYKDTYLKLYLTLDKNLSDSSGENVLIGVESGGVETYSIGKYREGFAASQLDVVTGSAVGTGTFSTWSVDFWIKMGTGDGATRSIHSVKVYDVSSALNRKFYWRHLESSSQFDLRLVTDDLFETVITSSTYSSALDKTSFNHIAIVANGTDVKVYENNIPKTTLSRELQLNGPFNLLGHTVTRSIYDSYKVWNKELSPIEIGWLSSGFTVYDHLPEHEPPRLPCVIIELQPPPPTEYLFGGERIDQAYFTLDLIFKEREHVRVVDGITMSAESLSAYYSDLLRDVLNGYTFTSSNVNAGQASVRIRQHRERYAAEGASFWLYGCSAEIFVPYKGGLA